MFKRLIRLSAMREKKSRVLALTLIVAMLVAPQPVSAKPARTMIDLGTLGGCCSEARDINNRGQVVGNSAGASFDYHAFLWQDGTMTDLGTLGGVASFAEAINDRGQVVGERFASGDTAFAFLWEDGVMTDLGTLGGRQSSAADINNRGQIVGISLTSGDL
jgi:probable HAF family extracellular repeat protein